MSFSDVYKILVLFVQFVYGGVVLICLLAREKLNNVYLVVPFSQIATTSNEPFLHFAILELFALKLKIKMCRGHYNSTGTGSG